MKINRNQIIPKIVLFIALLALSACSPSYFDKGTLSLDYFKKEDSSLNGLNQNLDLKANEIFITFNPRKKHMIIREYIITTLKKTDEEIAEQVKNIKALVKEGKYCKTKFGFDYFESVVELMGTDREWITGEYHLSSKEANVNKMFMDIFSKVMARKVKLTITTNIRLDFDGLDIAVDKEYTAGVYWHKEKKSQVVLWNSRLNVFESVLGHRNESLNEYPSILSYFGEDVSSPDKHKH